jgi:uncharacterized protein with GYD domain
MPNYIVLANFTEQGIRNVKQTVQRADAARELASRFGVNMKTLHWTHGQYDIVTFCEAKDEAGFTAFALALASAGNVKFQSLRALDRDEMSAIIAKLP